MPSDSHPAPPRCFVLTYREGLFAAVGHDLKLEVTDLDVDCRLDPPSVRARFGAGSVKVVAAMVQGRERPEAPAASDRRTIEAHVREDVLAADRYPSIEFASTRVDTTPSGYEVDGVLSLHGRERPIRVRCERRGSRLVATARIDLTEFGIRPFTAMMGALRVKRFVDVAIEADEPRGTAAQPPAASG